MPVMSLQNVPRVPLFVYIEVSTPYFLYALHHTTTSTSYSSMLALHSCDDSQLWVKNIEKNENGKICKKSVNFKTPYKNLEKYGSFLEFRTSMEKSVMLATLFPTVYLVIGTHFPHQIFIVLPSILKLPSFFL